MILYHPQGEAKPTERSLPYQFVSNQQRSTIPSTPKQTIVLQPVRSISGIMTQINAASLLTAVLQVFFGLAMLALTSYGVASVHKLYIKGLNTLFNAILDPYYGGFECGSSYAVSVTLVYLGVGWSYSFSMFWPLTYYILGELCALIIMILRHRGWHVELPSYSYRLLTSIGKADAQACDSGGPDAQQEDSCGKYAPHP